jgi:hypothetical protein
VYDALGVDLAVSLNAAQHELRLRAKHGDGRPQLVRGDRQKLIAQTQRRFGDVTRSALAGQSVLKLLFHAPPPSNFDLERRGLLLKGGNLAESLVVVLQGRIQ